MCIEIADVNHSVSGIVNHFNVFLLRLKSKNKITPKEQQLMVEKEHPLVRFYGLPKIHTTGVPLLLTVVFSNMIWLRDLTEALKLLTERS